MNKSGKKLFFLLFFFLLISSTSVFAEVPIIKLGVPNITSLQNVWTRSETNIFPNNLGDKVGIGTIEPDNKLHIFTDTSGKMFSLGLDGVGTFRMGVITGEKFTLGHNEQADFVLDATGNVGIGTDSPGETLHVNGNIGITRQNAPLARHVISGAGDDLLINHNGNSGDLVLATNSIPIITIDGATDTTMMNKQVSFSATTEDKVSYFDNRLGLTTMYGVGVEASSVYWKSPAIYRWYIAHNADGGTSDRMQLNGSGLQLPRAADTLSVAGDVDIGDKLHFSSDTDNSLEQVAINDWVLKGVHLHSEFGIWVRSDDTTRDYGMEADIAGADARLKIFAGGTEYLTVLAEGNVGINTTAPTHLLNVFGTGTVMNISGDTLIEGTLEVTNDTILGSDLNITNGNKINIINTNPSEWGSIYHNGTNLVFDSMENNEFFFGGENVTIQKDLRILSPSSLYIGGEGFARISAPNLTILGVSKVVASVDKDFGIVGNQNGQQSLGNLNNNDSINATAHIAAITYRGSGIAVLKFNEKWEEPNLASIGNNFGSLRLQNKNDNGTNFSIGFFDDTIRGEFLAVRGVINETRVIVLDNGLADDPFRTNINFNVSIKKNLVVEENTTTQDSFIGNFFKALTGSVVRFFDNVLIDKDLNVTKNLTVNDFAEFKSKVAQFHAHNITTPNTNWNNITWNITIDEETTQGFRIDITDNNESVIADVNGIIRVQGCVHPIWDGVGATNVKVAVRTLVNGVEKRCLQYSVNKNRVTDEIDTMNFAGTIEVNEGDIITVQYKVSNTDMNLEGDGIFDNPVAASVNFEMMSKQG